MHFIIVSGLLGVDRSSVILDIIDSLHGEKGCKMALILNDFANKRINEEVKLRYGLQVKDLKGGCISCSLKTDLIDNIKDLQAMVNPDVILFEPSGTTDPEIVKNALKDCSGLNISKISCIVLLDAEIFPQTWQMFERPLRNHLKSADLVLAKNMYGLSPEGLTSMKERVLSLGYAGLIEEVNGEHVTFDNIVKIFR